MSQSDHTDLMTLRVGIDPAELQAVAEALDRFGVEHGLPDTIVNAMNLSLDEVLNNAITHGQATDGGRTITISVSIVAGELVAEVKDHGIAFNPLEVPEADLSGGLRERKLGGVGLHFVRSLMDKVEYDRLNDVNRLRLRKRIVAGA